MPRYPNGDVPDSILVTFATGHNDIEGDWAHQTTPASNAKRLALVARARERTGRTLEVSPGSNAYRPRRVQRIFRNLYGNGAAVEGTSSHGGYWEGQDTMAFDFGNWAWVYAASDDPRDDFYADCRTVGLDPGLISPERGYPDEPWHVIDLDPYGPVHSIPTHDAAATRRRAETSMYIANKDIPETIYEVWRDIDGVRRMSVLGEQDAAFARQGGLVIEAEARFVDKLAKDLSYGTAVPSVAQRVLSTPVDRPTADGGRQTLLQDLANTGSLVRIAATASGASPAAITAAAEKGARQALSEMMSGPGRA